MHIEVDAALFNKDFIITITFFSDLSKGVDLNTLTISDLKDKVNDLLMAESSHDWIPNYEFLVADEPSKKMKVFGRSNDLLRQLFDGNAIRLQLGHVLMLDPSKLDHVDDFNMFEVRMSDDAMPIIFLVTSKEEAFFYRKIVELIDQRYKIRENYKNSKSLRKMVIIIKEYYREDMEDKSRIDLSDIVDLLVEYLKDTIPFKITNAKLAFPTKDKLYFHLLGKENKKRVSGLKPGETMMLNFLTPHDSTGNISQVNRLDTSALIPHDGSISHELQKVSVDYCTKVALESHPDYLEITTLIVIPKTNND